MISLEAKIGSFLSHASKIQSNSADQCSSRQNKNGAWSKKNDNLQRSQLDKVVEKLENV